MLASIVSYGLAVGAVYALIGITYNVMFAASRAFSFTAGMLGMLGGVLGALFIDRLGMPVIVGLLLMRESDLRAAARLEARGVGLPVGDKVPDAWKQDPRHHYDTTLSGLSNEGHDSWLRNGDGSPLLNEADRGDLIEFLKTL